MSLRLFFRTAIQRLRTAAGQPAFREFLLWCAPALLAGLALRIALTVALPYGVFHDDTPDFLTTPDQLLAKHHWALHEKKTFLTPIIFTVPVLLHLPALIFIPIFQHVLGLVGVLLAGGLCRLWLRWWRLFIIPVTLLVALHPATLWYEHTLMAEGTYGVCLLFLALAGTFYARSPGWGCFALLGSALFLTAGARPEGKLFFAFGFLLLLLFHLQNRKTLLWQGGALAALMLVTHLCTLTHQGGMLLYVTVARLTPHNPKSAPGLEPFLVDLRPRLQKRWDSDKKFNGAGVRREVAAVLKKYQLERGIKGGTDHLARKLAFETCRANWMLLPAIVLHKQQRTTREPFSGTLDDRWLFEKQQTAMLSDLPQWQRLSARLTGRQFHTAEETKAFLHQHYHPVRWFNRYLASWTARLTRPHLFDRLAGNPGVPVYLVVGLAGMVAGTVQRAPLGRIHLAWATTLLSTFAVIILTANIRARFQFVFEPFWSLYAAVLLDRLIAWGAASLTRFY